MIIACRSWSTVARDTLVFHADHTGGLRIISISDPENPAEIGQCPVGKVKDVAVRGNYVYTATYDSAVQIIDISDPSLPAKAASYNPGFNRTYRIIQHNDLAFVACYSNGLLVLDISDPLHPQEIGLYEIEKIFRIGCL
ncbi:MAG: hypothetical protein U5R06_01755 [candidate division KSB1 bacterium]|nr:hypothetical protein [candidate division KSB1 bacterium]